MKTAKLPKAKRTRTVGVEQGFSPARILVPVDFGELSDGALNRAQSIAAQFGSEMMLVHAVEPIIQPFEAIVVPPEMEEVNLRQLGQAKERAATLRDQVASTGIRCRIHVEVGKPWPLVVEIAKKWNADLIVLPTHGRRWLSHVLLGSTAERVVQHAPCSVLVVRSTRVKNSPGKARLEHL